MDAEEKQREPTVAELGISGIGGCFEIVLALMLAGGLVLLLGKTSAQDRVLGMYLCAFPLLYAVVYYAVCAAIRRARKDEVGEEDGR